MNNRQLGAHRIRRNFGIAAAILAVLGIIALTFPDSIEVGVIILVAATIVLAFGFSYARTFLDKGSQSTNAAFWKFSLVLGIIQLGLWLILLALGDNEDSGFLLITGIGFIVFGVYSRSRKSRGT